ncbi:MAG: CHAT domain-containing protein, partial [Planctomycetes bacterium]|nr:CHAT domain-containing protein [Planctomycetota bacterium]
MPQWDNVQAYLQRVRTWNAAPSAPPPWQPAASCRRKIVWLHLTLTQWVAPQHLPRVGAGPLAGWLQQARAAYRRTERTPESDAEFLRHELGLVADARRLGELDLAAAALAEWIVPATGVGHPEWSRVCRDQSYLARRAFRWQEAEDWLDRAEADADGARDRLLVATERASLALERGLPDRAVAPAQIAAELAVGIDDPLAEHAALFVALRLDAALFRPRAALSRWRAVAAGDLEHRLASTGAAGRFAQLRIRAAIALLQPDGAGVDAAVVAEAVDWLRAALAPGAVSPDERRLARNVLLAHLLDTGRIAEAGALLDAVADDLRELTEGDTALDERSLHFAALAVRLARADGSGPAVLAERHAALAALFTAMLARWREQPAGRRGLGPLFFDDRRLALAELIGSTLELRPGAVGRAAALQHLVTAQALGSLARALDAPDVTVAEVQRELCGPDRGVLVFAPGDGVCHVFAVGVARLAHVELPIGAAAIDGLRRDLLTAIQLTRGPAGASARGELTARRARLSAALLPPAVLAAVAGWRHVAVVGLQSLGYVPFELLVDGAGEPFGLQRVVSYLPSLPAGVWLRRQRPQPTALPEGGGRVLLVACPDLTPANRTGGGAVGGAVPLPFGRVERAELAAGCAGATVHWLTGADAGIAAITAAAPPSYDVLQILAHGVRDERRDDAQGIALPDGALFGAELEQQALPGVVVLTVCGAGRGPLRRG